MASIYRPRGRRLYRISYLDEHGRRVTVPGFRDKQATQEKARKLERDAERARAGLPVAQQDRLRQPLQDAIEAFVNDLTRQGRSPCHFKEARRHLLTLADACHWANLAAIRPDALTYFLAQLQRRGRSPRTLNGYRDHLSTFLEWCVRQGWMEANPVARVAKARRGGKKARPRRAYTPAEFQQLLQVAGCHRTLYTVAGLSGLRRSELRRLEKRDLTPLGEQPTWHLRAEIVKGRRREVVPMLPDVVPVIRPLWEAATMPTTRLFPRIPRTQTLHKHLARAKIARQDAEGRWLDFHSFRYFFCTLCAKHMPIQLVRALMRHRDIRMTANLYMDLGLTDIGEAVQQLPSLLPPNAALPLALPKQERTHGSSP
jgi:integrase